MTKILKTDFRQKRDERDLAIYYEYKEKTANKENAKTKIIGDLRKKHGIYSDSTIYHIVKRVEQMLLEEAAK